MELRGKIGDAGSTRQAAPSSSAQLKIRSEAIVALMSLGHHRASAEKAVRSAAMESPGTEFSLEDLVRKALAHTSK